MLFRACLKMEDIYLEIAILIGKMIGQWIRGTLSPDKHTLWILYAAYMDIYIYGKIVQFCLVQISAKIPEMEHLGMET